MLLIEDKASADVARRCLGGAMFLDDDHVASCRNMHGLGL